MSILQAIVLGVVQGITEFLPISSTGHLIIVPAFLGWEKAPFVFDTSLHLGTTLAVVLYFFKDLIKASPRTLTALILGSLPVMVIGFFGGDIIENTFRTSQWVALFLVLGSVLMYIAQLFQSKQPAGPRENSDMYEREGTPSIKTSVLIGLFQSLALLPGISRSGSTISGGLFFGLSREEAARFSFLLSTPAILAAAGYKLLTTYDQIAGVGYAPFTAGMVSSFVIGILAIKGLLNFLKKRSLNVFIVYRLALALLILAVL